MRNISLAIKMENYKLVENDNGQVVVHSEKPDVVFKPDVSSPCIPYIGINIVVSQSEDYDNATLSGNDVVVGEDVVLAPNPQYVFSNSTKNCHVVSGNVSYQETIYPNKNIEYVGSSKMRGYKILSFLVSPFRYDAGNKRLFFKNNLVLQLKTNGNKIVGNSNCYEDIVKNMVVNGDEIRSLYSKMYENKSATLDYEYLIITNAALKPAFQKLADWKTRKGIPTKVLTTEEITSDYTGATLQIQIKNALKYYYDNSGEKLAYVLLGGDVGIVPTAICYAYYDGNVRNMPTDLYYGCFDTMDWDANKNGIWGEIDDNVDICPELFVSRASVSNVSQTESFVNRVISYEANPIWTGNAKKMLMAGTKREVDFSSNMGIISDSQIQSYYLYRWYVDPYWDGEKVEFYDTHTDFSGDAGYDFSAEHLQDQLDNGYGFVHVMTHGNPYVWAMEPLNDYYSINNAAAQNNQGETIIITSSCLTNAFDSISTCLSESLMRNPNSGVLAYLGCSREGFGTADILNIGPSNYLDGNIMSYIFNLKDNNFAKCVVCGKSMRLSQCYTYESPYRWLHFGVNAMGDPEMPIYTTTPEIFNNVTLSYSSNILQINTNVDSCRICVMGRDNTTYLCMKDVSSISGFQLSDGEYNVCITKNGYIPYNRIFSINQGVYIQNESLIADLDIMSPDVYIGSNVKPSDTQGPVTIEERAHVKINASNGVLIKNNFEVKTGATLEITPSGIRGLGMSP